MKFINKFREVFSLITLIIIALLVVSCGEDSETDVDMRGEAKVMVVHSAPNIGNLRLFIDSAATSTAITYGVNTSYVTISQVGRRNAKLKLSPSDEVIIDQSIFLNPQRNYSFFIADRKNDESPLYIAVRDDLKVLARERVGVRFINMIPDTLRLDLRTQFSTDTVSKTTFSNAAFKSVSIFQDLKAGTYTFEALRAGTLTDTVIRTQTITFEERKNYTIWVGGLLDSQGNKPIRAYIIQND